MEHEDHKEGETTHAHHEPKAPKVKPVKGTVLVFGAIGAVVIVFLIGFGILNSQMRKMSTHPFVLKVADTFNIPVVKAQGQSLLYSDYINDVAALKKLSANPTFSFGPTTDKELSDLVVANFLTRIKTEELAKKFNVTVTPAEVEERKGQLFAQFGEEEVKKSILDSYGWDFDTFVKKIIEPSILNEKVRTAFAQSTGPEAKEFQRDEAYIHHILIKVNNPQDEKEKAEKKKQAESVLLRLKKGEDFAKLAKEFSGDDGSKENGGDLGWLAKGQTVEPFNGVAFTIELKKLSDVIETSYGYHILKVDERRTGPDFDAFMDSEVKKTNPQISFGIHNPLENLSTPPAVTPAAQ